MWQEHKKWRVVLYLILSWRWYNRKTLQQQAIFYKHTIQQRMQHQTQIIPRSCSHSCSFVLYIFKFFNKHINSFINLCSLLLWKFKPPHVSLFCDLQNKANTNPTIYYHTTLYNNLWKCIRRGCLGYLWPFTKQKSEFPCQNKHFAC